MQPDSERRFYMSMAKEFHYVNVDEMLEGMTSSQMTEWMAYSKLEAAEFKSSQNSKQMLRSQKGK